MNEIASTSKGMIFNRITLFAFGLAVCSCMEIQERSFGSDGMPNENLAATKSKDFSIEGYRKAFNGQGVVMRYKVGDRFRLRQQMFLSYSAENLVQLRELSSATVPRIEEYRNNPEAYRYGGHNPYQVVKLVPAGTIIEIVKIAEIDLSPYPYFVIRGDDNWFRCSTFSQDNNLEYTSERITIEKAYDKKLFEKL